MCEAADLGNSVRKVDKRLATTGESGLDFEVRAVPSELWAVRRAVGQLAFPASVVENAQLLVTELVANSIRHAGIRPQDRICIKARFQRGSLRVDVLDGGRGGPTPHAGGIRPAPGASSGWGLFLVEALATRWGFGTGRFWFELDLERPETA
jgi:anti-sigma regulatory factor (Ser/Thr protein kinase)